jgi:hypothetical protein
MRPMRQARTRSAAEAAIHEGTEELVSVPEILIERADAHAGSLGNSRGRRATRSAALQNARDSGEDRIDERLRPLLARGFSCVRNANGCGPLSVYDRGQEQRRNESPVWGQSQEGRMKVLVSGGGIAGSAAALFLARRGYDVRIIDRVSSFARRGYAITLKSFGLS